MSKTCELIKGENGDWITRERDMTPSEEADLRERQSAAAHVPQSIDAAQLRAALNQFGRRDDVEAKIAAADRTAQDWYEYSPTFSRGDSRSSVFGFTPVELDQLWTQGAGL